jgi:two-component system cell cycle sensor histidine kinase/response regulator CckA
VLDAAGEVREANERAELLFGRSRAAMVGRPFEALAGPGPADLGGDGACEIRVVRGDGDVRIAALTASRVDFGEEALRLIILRDVTDARRVELELRQSQKMEAVGRLASGVAHDFNNILSVILGEAEWALTRLPAGGELSEIRESIALIQDTGGQAVHLVRQLLAFSRKQPATPQVLSLGDLVTGVGGMLRRLLGRDVELRVETAPDLRPILADPSQLAQVLLNLGVNARDAMPDGGTLTLHTANAGASVLLEVRDTGCGMSPEVQARIFEPFFTTKEPGKGTGLGLSTVYGIVQQAGGSISVESEVGRGTVFRVLFPAAGAPAA